jgi:hypothetical protein
VRRVLTDARNVARNTSLSPPARAAFFSRTLLPPAGPFGAAPGAKVSVSDTEALRSLAISLIDRYLDESVDSDDPPDPKNNPMHSAALQYVEAVLRQHEIVEDLNRASTDPSSLHAALTDPERSRVHEVLLNCGGLRLDSLLDRWQRVVEHTQNTPESLGFEEYENWLRARDVLGDVMSVLSPSSREILESRVRPLDESLWRATREVPSSIRPVSPWRPQGWWWYRVPRRVATSFNERLADVAPSAATNAQIPDD